MEPTNPFQRLCPRWDRHDFVSDNMADPYAAKCRRCPIQFSRIDVIALDRSVQNPFKKIVEEKEREWYIEQLES